VYARSATWWQKLRAKEKEKEVTLGKKNSTHGDLPRNQDNQKERKKTKAVPLYYLYYCIRAT
jgi:hypothetical protein